MIDLVRTVDEYMQSCGMLKEGSRVILAVSGGADSVCLFHVLRELRDKYRLSLFTVHIHHGIRGAAADGDEVFVKALAERCGLPFRSFREDVPRFAKEQGLSREEAGRIVRKKDLLDAKAVFKADRIATAHHLDDQAETVLLMLCRGSGLAGFSGIAPSDSIFIRPLLCVSRPEIIEWLTQKGYDWREDATNCGDDYTRNRIRHHILPYLSSGINPAASRHIAEAAGSAREALTYMREMAEKELAAAREQQGKAAGNTCPLPDAVLSSPPALRPYIIQAALLQEAGSRRDITREHIGALLELLVGRTGAALDLPGGLTAVKEYTGVSFYKKEGNRSGPEYSEVPLVPGSSVLAGTWTVTCESVPSAPFPVPEKNYTKWIDSDIIADSLCVRTRRRGDYLTVTDDGKKKSLSDYLIDEKVPRSRRDTMLLVADGPEIVWIPGKRLGARYKITERTAHVLRLTAFENTGAPESGAQEMTAEQENQEETEKSHGKNRSHDPQGKNR